MPSVSSPNYQIHELPFTANAVAAWKEPDDRQQDWPVVYLLSNDRSMYVGETLSATRRLRQHLESNTKSALKVVRVVIDDRFNKSACLDLESFLIQMFQGDGRYEMLNGNGGITDADYFDRESYRQTFDELFDSLRRKGLFRKTSEQIRNDELFRLSPYKSVTDEQTESVRSVLTLLASGSQQGEGVPIVINGDPGTGKTIVAVYLMKMLADLSSPNTNDLEVSDSPFSDFFEEAIRGSFERIRFGMVVPQQALRKSLQRVFKKIEGLNPRMIMTPFEVGMAEEKFDLLVVDEAHRLNHRANQPAGSLNVKFQEINKKLFGADDYGKTQLDWIRAVSRQQVLLLDVEQSVRTADLPRETAEALRTESRIAGRELFLKRQIRVQGGREYIDFAGKLIRGEEVSSLIIGDYDFQIFDNISEMRSQIEARDVEFGLSRMVAGYAWPWVTKPKKKETRTTIPKHDITIDNENFAWNSSEVDWVSSPNALHEMGSIHSVQGYDLNYAGVVIGKDLRFSVSTQKIYFDRKHYFDRKGIENNGKLGIEYSDSDVLTYVQNIYRVLMTRGARGTYLYICDPNLREHLREVYQKAVKRG